MTRSRPNTCQALLVYSLLQAAVRFDPHQCPLRLFCIFNFRWTCAVGRVLSQQRHHECIQEILGYFLSILGGRRVSGWHLVRKKTPARLVSSPPITLRQASLRGEFLHRASLQPAYLPLALSQSECSRSVSSQLGYSLSVFTVSAFSS